MSDSITQPDPSMLDEACHKAVECLNAGQVEAAETVFRAVLQAAPLHARANYHLGMLLLPSQGAAAVLPHLLAALEGEPETAEHWLLYAEALIQTGKLIQGQKGVRLI